MQSVGRPAQTEHRCSCHGTLFKSSKKKCTHEHSVRQWQNKKSVADSQIGTKDTQLKDADMVDLPSSRFTKQKEHIEEIYGFTGDENLKSLAVKINAPVTDKKADPRAGMKSSNGGSTKTSDTIEQIKQTLINDSEWELAESIYRSNSFADLPSPLTLAFAKSFILLGGIHQSKHEDFPRALSKIVQFLTVKQVPPCLVPPYQKFFSTFIPTSESVQALRILLAFAIKIDADMDWMTRVETPTAVIGEGARLSVDEQFNVLTELSYQKDFFSSRYFSNITDIIYDSFGCKCIGSTIVNCFELLHLQTTLDHNITKDFLLDYAGLEREYGFETLEQQLQELNALANRSFSNSQLITVLKWANKNKCENWEAVKVLVQTLSPTATPDQIGTLLEDSIKLVDLDKAKEEKIKWDLKQQQKLKEEKKQSELKAEEEKKEKEEQHRDSLRQIFGQYISVNDFLQCALEDVLAFEKDLQHIAVTIGKTLRAEQLVTMGLLLLSQKHTTLIQLATGFGKSMLLGILAAHLNKTTGKKVIVVVPTAFLHAYQQYFYCPTASKIPDDITDPNLKQIFYCSYDRFDAPEFEMPEETILLIDEFHEIFFNKPATVVNGKLISIILKLQAADQVIGVSATYKGDIGIKQINTIMNAQFSKAPQSIKERELQLTVFGEVQDIPTQVVQLTREKSKQMPVIIFCSDLKQYKQLIPEAKVFAGSEVGELMSILKSLQQSANVIVVTTSSYSKGVDFLFAVPQAYVIHTVLPQSMVQLKQDSGRGVRGSDLPITGAIFTEKSYTNIQDVEIGLCFAEGFEKMYPADHMESLKLLQQCSISNQQSPVNTFTAAVAMLNQGESMEAIHTKLATVKRFKNIIIDETPKQAVSPFKIPFLAQKQNQEKYSVGLLGKRRQNFVSKKQGPMDAFLKKQKTDAKYGTQDQPIVQEVSAFADEQPKNKAKSNEEMIEDQEENKGGDEEIKNEQQSFKRPGPNKVQLTPGVLKEKELEEARAVFAKHGFAVPEPVAKNSKSRTSSEMLFGQSNESQTGNGSSNKKRETKAVHKEDDAMSMVSEKTNKSFGNALKGVPGTVFEVEGVKFTVLDEKDKVGNRMVQCQCKIKISRGNAKRHTERNNH